MSYGLLLLAPDLVLELPVSLPLLETLMSEVTLVTPWVSRAMAMARPTASGLSAEPLSMTSPLLASAWMLALDSSLSACSLPVTIVFNTVSSVLPVGAPATDSLVRTIATPLPRSALSSEGLRRHSVIRKEMSALELAALAIGRVSVVDEAVPATEADGEVALAPDVVSVEEALPAVAVPAMLVEGLAASVAAAPAAGEPRDEVLGEVEP